MLNIHDHGIVRDFEKKSTFFHKLDCIGKSDKLSDTNSRQVKRNHNIIKKA